MVVIYLLKILDIWEEYWNTVLSGQHIRINRCSWVDK